PVLAYWRDAEGGAKALDELCRVGGRVLSRFEEALDGGKPAATEKKDGPSGSRPPVEAYEFYQAVFRNRLLRRAALKRRFHCYMDFIDLRARRGPARFLIPQTVLGVVERQQPSRGKDLISGLQNRCFEEARGRALKGSPRPWPIDLVPGRGAVDYLLVD